MKQDIDKLQKTIEDGIEVYQDIDDELKKDGNINIMEGSLLVVKHGGKAIRLVTGLKEIGQELIDIDGEEAKEIVNSLVGLFGGSEEANAAIKEIAEGTGLLNSGIQKLIELKK